MAELDHHTALEIEMAALRRACDLLPLRVEGYSPRGRYRLGEHVTADDYRHGVRASFGAEPDFEEWMVTPLVDAFHDHQRNMAQVREMADGFVRAIFSGHRAA